MHYLIVVSVFISVFVPPALAQESLEQSLAKCYLSNISSERLDCYDTVVRQSKNPKKPSNDALSVAPSISDIEYQNVSPGDIHLVPNKYLLKGVSMSYMSCYYANTKDYRCLNRLGLKVLVNANFVLPSPARHQIEKDCDHIDKTIVDKCLKTIKFVPISYSYDVSNTQSKRLIIEALTIDIEN